MRLSMINCIQQIGVGVPDIDRAFRWFRKTFRMDVPVFDDEGEPVYMVHYMGGKLQRRHAILAANLQGGSGFEIWQYLSRKPKPPASPLKLGDLGINIVKVKAPDTTQAFNALKERKATIPGKILGSPSGKAHFFVEDPFGNLYQIIEDEHWFKRSRWITGGPCGCIIGVSDIDRSKRLYEDILGYKKVVYDEVSRFDDFASLPGGEEQMRRVLLIPSEEPKGLFSRLIGPGQIELVQCMSRKPKKIFEGRYWGDLGFIHICFDIHDMQGLKTVCEKKGFPFTADSSDAFDMGDASGHFSYIEDPDGTLIEFVETYKIPIIKKIGWYLDLKKRDPEKPLPDWMIKLLGLGRVKD
jgi:catechol 2,3-dioxygenase-like lactoylglutathione lyase family enzyme